MAEEKKLEADPGEEVPVEEELEDEIDDDDENDEDDIEVEVDLEPTYSEAPPDEYASIKEDFAQIVDRGVKSFQEEAPGRKIEHIILRLQGRYGLIVETTDRGLISMPEMSGVELDNQGNPRIQRMFMGMNSSASTKDTEFLSVNLLGPGQTAVKEFEVNAAAHEVLKRCVRVAQTAGEKIQQKVDEEDFQHFERYSNEGCENISINLDNEPKIDTDQVFRLVALARQVIKQRLGKKLVKCKVVFFSIGDSQELADTKGGRADTVVTRTGFAIQAQTDKKNEVYGGVRGTGGMSVLTRYDPSKSIEQTIGELADRIAQDCIDLDRAQPPSVLGGDAYIVMGPEVTGVLAHEVYGHPSEADIILDNKHDKDVDLSLKARLGGQVSENPKFHIIDDGDFEVKIGDRTITNCYGSLVVDDDGNVAKRTYLVEKGIQQLAMNSADTFSEIISGLPADIAKKMKEHGLTGNLRSQRFDAIPMVRMTNTFVLPDEEGPNSIAELAAMVPSSKKGVYIKTCVGGWVDTSTGEFQVTGRLGYLIENGVITDKPVRDVIVRGNIAKFGGKIQAIGSSQTIDGSFTGWCGKNNQWVPVEGGGPAMLIEDASVGKQESPWSFAELYKEYARQIEEVAAGKRKQSEIYIKQIEEETEERVKDHSRLCLVTACLPIEDEVRLVAGRESPRTSLNMLEGGRLEGEEDE